jgi:hypothetical protein
MKTGPTPMVRIKRLQGTAAGFGSIKNMDESAMNNQFDKAMAQA